jgi:mitogen-activated protein kinase organizer 1
VGQEEMLGAESQNMFDFYGNDEDDNDDDDAASEEDPGEDTGGIVVPRGALQVAGESGGESLASSSRTLHGELPQMFLRQGTVDYPSAQPGEATGLNENPVVVQHRLRDPGAMGGQPIMEVLVPPSSQGVSRPDEPSVHNRRENFSENVGSNSPLDAASKRLVEAWAEANSMAVSDVLPREQFASAENVESRPETSQTNTVADDAKAQHMENEICQDSKVVGQTTPTSEQSTAKRTISEIANSSSGQGHPCPSQADDDRKLDSDPDRIRGGSPGSSFVPSPDNDTNAAENELVRTRFARQPGQSEEAVPHEGIARLVGHDGPVSSVIFSADAKYCLTGSYDRTVRLWNPLRLDPAHPPPKNLLRNPDGGIRMQSLPHSLPIQVYGDGVTHPVSAIAIDEQSTTILTGSEKTLVVHDVVTGQSQRRLQGHVGRINAVAINRDAQIYLSASYDATVRIWDGRSRSFEPIQILKEAKDSVTAVHFVQSDSLTLIRTASVDGVIRSYDVRMGMLQFSDVGDPITGMCVTSNPHHCVVNCLDGALRLCDLEQGKVLKHYTGGHKAGQYSLDCVVSAADDYVVTGSEDGSAVFYDMSSGRVAQVLEGHRHPTCSVACHGLLSSVAVSASYDGTSVVWGHNDSLMQW